jgi:site-specific recombinase XerD
VERDALEQVWLKTRTAWLEGRHTRTVQLYEFAARQFFEWVDVSPWQVSPEMVQKWIRWMAREGGRDGGPLSAATINQRVSALASFYTFAAEHAVDDRGAPLWPPEQPNPFRDVARPRVRRRTKPLTIHEAQAILAAIYTESMTGQRDHALLLTIATTDRPAAEVLSLQLGKWWKSRDGLPVFVIQGEPVKLERRAREAIIDYLETSGRLATMRSGEYVFAPLYPERIQRVRPGTATDPDRPISGSTANAILSRYARRAGIDPKRVRLGWLRGTLV